MRTGERAAGIILKDNKILVFRRVKGNRCYHAFIGGGIEVGETPDQAIMREIKEEASVNINKCRLLFRVKTKLDEAYIGSEIKRFSPLQHFYLITNFEGTPKLGGPEKERACESNQYHFEWIPLEKISETKDLYPNEAREKLVEYIKLGKLRRENYGK